MSHANAASINAMDATVNSLFPSQVLAAEQMVHEADALIRRIEELRDLASEALKDAETSPDEASNASLAIQLAIARFKPRLSEAFADSIRPVGGGKWRGDSEELRRVRNEDEERERELEFRQKSKQQQLSRQDVHWFGERGKARNLAVLSQARESDQALSGAIQEAEQAIIIRIAIDPEQWLEALGHADTLQTRWLVTALLGDLIQGKKEHGQLKDWGDPQVAAPSLIQNGEQLNALRGLLKHTSAEVRAETVFALAEGGGGEVVSDFRRIAMDRKEASPVRSQAFRGLGLIGGPEAVVALADAMADEHELEPLSYALYSLRRLLSKVATLRQKAYVVSRLRQVADDPRNPSMMRSSARKMLLSLAEVEQHPTSPLPFHVDSSR